MYISMRMATLAAAALVSTIGYGQTPVVLQPAVVHKISDIVPELSGQQVLEMSSGPGQLWVAVRRPGGKASSFVRVPIGAGKPIVINLDEGTLSDMAATATGPGAVVVSGRSATIQIFSEQGAKVKTIPIPCYGSESLVSFAGDFASMCADGRLTRYGPTSTKEFSTWGGRGKLAQLLGEGNLIIVDPFTGQVAMQNLTSLRLTTPGRPPELDSAFSQAERSINTAKVAMKPTDPPLGRPMIVADLATDQRSAYILTSPYHPSTGPTVIRLDGEGRATGRFRLAGTDPAGGVLNEIEVVAGNLYLGSSRGSIYQYRLPN